MRMVVKVGTRVVLHSDGYANGDVLMPLARQISTLRAQGCEVILVSSGAVGLGRASFKPRGEETIAQKQALAALGQVELMHMYKRLFELLNIPVAQVLLTRDDLNARERYLNARNTLQALLRAGVLPIINENDSVATDEIKFGDNDILAALVGGLVDADLVVNLTQTRGLLGPDGEVVRRVERIDEVVRLVDSSLSAGGTGGMLSKLEAARAALDFGTRMVIAAAAEDDVLLRLARGEELGTLFQQEGGRLGGRKRWLAAASCKGKLHIDAGAARALTSRGKSLLAVGIKEVVGQFQVGELVTLVGPDLLELGRGLTNLSSEEIQRAIAESSGKRGSPEIIHCDNLVIHRQPRAKEAQPC